MKTNVQLETITAYQLLPDVSMGKVVSHVNVPLVLVMVSRVVLLRPFVIRIRVEILKKNALSLDLRGSVIVPMGSHLTSTVYVITKMNVVKEFTIVTQMALLLLNALILLVLSLVLVPLVT